MTARTASEVSAPTQTPLQLTGHATQPSSRVKSVPSSVLAIMDLPQICFPAGVSAGVDSQRFYNEQFSCRGDAVPTGSKSAETFSSRIGFVEVRWRTHGSPKRGCDPGGGKVPAQQNRNGPRFL